MSHKSYSPYFQLMLLAGLCFALIGSTVFVGLPVEFPRLSAPDVVLTPLPFPATQAVPPYVLAQAAVVVDPVSGVVLFEKNADRQLAPVSTTKMVTALVALENQSNLAVVEVPRFEVEPQNMKLFAGERITLRDLLYGALVWSANDAAEAIARTYPGGRQAFIQAMNDKVQALGMTNTRFYNPSGLPEPGHVSTARDLARFAAVAMANPEFAAMVGTRDITVRSIDGRVVHKLTNLNELLGTVPGVLGVKTGWTEDTGGALVTYVEQERHPLIVVVLGSADRFGDSKNLITWAYQSYVWKTIDRSSQW